MRIAIVAPMRAACWAVATVALGAGCSKSWKPLDVSALARQPARTIGVVSTTPVAFVATTPGTAVTGLAGMAYARGAGQGIIEENHIADPSGYIANRLLVALAARHSLMPRTPKPISAADEPLRWDTDLFLRVRTEEWSLSYLPGDLTHYRIYYQASIELHDSRGQQVIASGQCKGKTFGNPNGPPTYDELLGQRAWILRRKLQEAAAFCAERFARELFAIELPEERPFEPSRFDAKDVLAACRLEQTPAWKAADPAEQRRLMEECWTRRTSELVGPPPASEPSRPSAPATPTP
jgi:hypothetical protein